MVIGVLRERTSAHSYKYSTFGSSFLLPATTSGGIHLGILWYIYDECSYRENISTYHRITDRKPFFLFLRPSLTGVSEGGVMGASFLWESNAETQLVFHLFFHIYMLPSLPPLQVVE
jgi:hypothetical protein